MHSLLKDYNRTYYRNIIRINAVAKWKLFRLWVAWQIMRVAFFISPDAKQAIESKLKPRKEW